jgi:transcriptional regulator with PAS, ATPase and Fis domain
MLYNILAIAPYQSLGDLFEKVSGDYPDCNINVAIFDLQEAANYITEFGAGQYDVIISRGGTAEMLRKATHIPVIDIEVSAYDMLRSIQMAQQYEGPCAIIGFDAITHIAPTICSILSYAIPTYGIDSKEKAEEKLTQLKAEGTELIVGDVVTSNIARSMGMQTILISSGVESVKKALDESVGLLNNIAELIERNQTSVRVLDKMPNQCLLLSEDGTIIYANQRAKIQNDSLLLEHIKAMLPKLINAKDMHQAKNIGKTMYQIYANAIQVALEETYAFYITESPHSAPGLAPYTVTTEDTEDDFYVEGIPEKLTSKALIEKAIESSGNAPIFIHGEIGTGQSMLAYHIHTGSRRKANSFITVDTSQLSEKMLASIIDDVNSPFNAEGYTIYFKDIHLLPMPVQIMLLNYLKDTGLQNRHQLISSTFVDLDQWIRDGRFSQDLFATLCVLSIPLLSLAECRDCIPLISRFLISKYNVRYGKQIIGFDSDAASLMIEYSWPNNIDQLKRVLRHFVTSIDNDYISYQDVKTALRSECENNETDRSGIDLTKPLEDIERDIIRKILIQNSMNQTLAAQSLGISRTTMWRKLKDM